MNSNELQDFARIRVQFCKVGIFEQPYIVSDRRSDRKFHARGRMPGHGSPCTSRPSRASRCASLAPGTVRHRTRDTCGSRFRRREAPRPRRSGGQAFEMTRSARRRRGTRGPGTAKRRSRGVPVAVRRGPRALRSIRCLSYPCRPRVHAPDRRPPVTPTALRPPTARAAGRPVRFRGAPSGRRDVAARECHESLPGDRHRGKPAIPRGIVSPT